MNENQLAEIRNHLLSKKLPIDVLLEVQDHFVSQIMDTMREEQLSFEEAFLSVKISWDKELKPYWDGGLCLEDVSNFMRRIKKANEIANISWAIKRFWIPVGIISGSAFVLESNYFGIFSLLVISGLVLYALYSYISHYKDFKLAKKYDKYILTLHQHSIFVFIILISPIINVYNTFFQNPERYKVILTAKHGFWYFLFVELSIVLIVFTVFYSISAQKNYLKQIEKVKPFLKYLS